MLEKLQLPDGWCSSGRRAKEYTLIPVSGERGVVLVGLDNVEVRTLTLGEAVLAVKLKLGSYNRVLTPAVHVKGSLGKHEGGGIRDRNQVAPPQSRLAVLPAVMKRPAELGLLSTRGSITVPPKAWTALGRASMASV